MKIKNFTAPNKDYEELTPSVDTKQFNTVELRYLKLIKKKEKLDLPLTKEENEILNG